MARRSLVALLCCLLAAWSAAASAQAQQPGPGPFTAPRLSDSPEGGFARRAATATPTPTVTATPAATPAAGATLPTTGADPLRLALAGLTLLGFGLALRFRVALADARRPH